MKTEARYAKFEEHMLGLIELNPDDQADALVQAEFLAGLADAEPGASMCCMVSRLDTPLYIGGYWMVGPGVVHVFLMPKKDLTFKEGGIMFADLKKWLHDVVKFTNAHRVQTFCKPDATKMRFLGKLGFACEGRLSRYTINGEDVIMWGLIPEYVWRGRGV